MQLFRQIQIYIPLFKSGWWLVALSTLFAITLSLYLSYTATPVYQTSTKVIILPNPLMSREADELKAQEILEERILAATHVERLISGTHRRQTTPLLPLTDEQKETLGKYEVSGVVLPQTSVIDLYVTGPDPDIARILANGLAEQGILIFQQHHGNLYRMEFLDPAGTPSSPISPTPSRDAPLAAFLGLAFGVALLLAYEQLRWFLSELAREQEEGATALPTSPLAVANGPSVEPLPNPSTNGRHPEHDSTTHPTQTN